MSSKTVSLLLLLSASVPALSSYADDFSVSDHAKVFQQQLDDLVQGEVKALGLGLLLDGELVFDYYSGNNAQGVSVNRDTRFRLGGMSSLLVKNIVLEMVQQGSLSLDDAIDKHLPLAAKIDRGSYPLPTIRQLLQHTSGLPVSYFKGMWLEDAAQLQPYEKIISDIHMVQAPGQIYSVSNIGVSLLALMVEAKTGLPFAELVKRRLFIPLKMNRSSYQPQQPAQNYAAEYHDGDLMPYFHVRDNAALGLLSSVGDLAQYISLLTSQGKLQQRPVLSAKSIQLMFTEQELDTNYNYDRSVALGWQIRKRQLFEETLVYSRHGTATFSNSRISIVPEKRMAMIVVCNENGKWELINKLEQLSLKAMVAWKESRLPASLKEETEETFADPAPIQASPFASAYASSIGLVKVKQQDNNRYRMDVMGWDFNLERTEQNWFSISYDLLGFIPLKLDWVTRAYLGPVFGGEQVLSYYHGKRYLIGVPFNRQTLPAIWRKRLGRYRIINPDPLLDIMDIRQGELSYKDGYFVFRYKLPGWIPLTVDIPLEVISDSRLRLAGKSMLSGEIIELKSTAAGEVLGYSGYHLQKQP